MNTVLLVIAVACLMELVIMSVIGWRRASRHERKALELEARAQDAVSRLSGPSGPHVAEVEGGDRPQFILYRHKDHFHVYDAENDVDLGSFPSKQAAEEIIAIRVADQRAGLN